MVDNNPQASTSGNSQGRGRGRGRGGRTTNNRGWRPYNRFWRGGSRQPTEPPTSIDIHKSFDSISSVAAVPQTEGVSMSIEIDRRNTYTAHYPGWQFYFPQIKYNAESVLVQRIKAIQEHIKGHPSQYVLEEITKNFWFILDIPFLLKDAMFMQRWITFNKDLTEEPELTLNIAGCAMNKLISNNNITDSFKLIRARIQNYQPVVNLRALKGKNYDRLIAIRCTVTRAGPMEVLPTWLAFQCSTCKTEQAIKQPEGKITFPKTCSSKNCKMRSNFKELFYSPYSRCVAFQKIRVQEIIRGQKYDEGRVPRSIEIQMTEDLVDSVYPGDDITLTGILKVRPQEEFYNKQEAATYNMFIKAVSVESRKKTATTSTTGILEFTEKDLEAINMIRSEPRLFRFLVQSLCPKIFGHEMVKAGLVLGLFGATDIASSKNRSQIHVLVVGDPGVGKSQMLQACTEVSPRGIFVCGTGNSAAGLTVVVRKEKSNLSSGNAIEAGALVLADQGVCCIDEFDKMSANHHALLEVMEQQMISVAKAGALCSLPARTSILAAANPVGGHYDRSKTVSENLKMSGPLLSRFDLVFILLDRHDIEFDNMLTEHVLGKLPNYIKKIKNRGDTSILEDNGDCENLQDNLKLELNEKIDYLPPILFQKYIAYARNNCQPILSSEAGVELKNFYLELRNTRVGLDTIPVTTRQMEALIRLTEARARTELSDIASREHALDVIAIMKFSLLDVFTTHNGELQMERNIMGSGMSQASLAKKFLKILQQRSSALKKRLFDLNELKDIATNSGLSGKFLNIIDSLNNQGYLLKKGQNIYQLHQI